METRTRATRSPKKTVDFSALKNNAKVKVIIPFQSTTPWCSYPPAWDYIPRFSPAIWRQIIEIKQPASFHAWTLFTKRESPPTVCEPYPHDRSCQLFVRAHLARLGPVARDQDPGGRESTYPPYFVDALDCTWQLSECPVSNFSPASLSFVFIHKHSSRIKI